MAEKTTFSQASLSFTLPISCQICLCKVKEPLVCPNQHVFCTQCMKVWLEHNQHCPSCRVPITPNTPCKQIIGGPSPSNTGSSRFSTPALRKVRFEMMYREYEDEITKLCDEVKSLKKKNKGLKARLEEECSKTASNGSSQPSILPTTNVPRPSSVDGSEGRPSLSEAKPDERLPALVRLTKNLEVATATYNQVRSDMDKLKQVNTKLRDENSQLLRENGRLKQDIHSRSPKKYQRFTAAAQHNRLMMCEKQVKQLRKALERSDNYIEELENQLEKGESKVKEVDVNDCSMGQIIDKFASKTRSRKKRTDRLTGEESSKHTYSGNTSLSGPGHASPGNSSFLEAPSPITPASSFKKLSLNSVTAADAAVKDGSLHRGINTGQTNSRLSCNRQLDFDSATGKPHDNVKQIISSDESSKDSNTTFDNLDYTLTAELSDCAKLMKEAALRLDTRKEREFRFSESESPSVEMRDGFTSQHDSCFLLSIEHPYSVLSKSDFQFGQLPSYSSSTVDNSTSKSYPTNSNNSVTVKQTEISNKNLICSTKQDFSMSSNGFHANRPGFRTADLETPHDLFSDVTPTTYGVLSTGGKEMLSSGTTFSSERKSFGKPRRVPATSVQVMTDEEDGRLKRKTGECFRGGVSSPNKATKSD